MLKYVEKKFEKVLNALFVTINQKETFIKAIKEQYAVIKLTAELFFLKKKNGKIIMPSQEGITKNTKICLRLKADYEENGKKINDEGIIIQLLFSKKSVRFICDEAFKITEGSPYQLVTII